MKKEIKKRTPMPHQAPEERIRNFSEVALGYTEEDALCEAARCLQCKQQPCVAGCPVTIDIPYFIKLVAEGQFADAASLIKTANSLPAICGRVCPQEEQCEQVCVMNKLGQPIAIGRLERFVADFEAAQSNGSEPETHQPENPELAKYSVAVVGSGPAGLTVAGELAKMGYSVTIFEALHKPGGVLRYGIPEFRLPSDILDREINYVKSLGVQTLTNVVIGKTITIEQLLENGFEAVFVGSGAGAPAMMSIPGENLNGVLSANEFLTRVNLMRANRFPEYATPVRIPTKAAVIGAGNVAMDAARTALRIGAKEVAIVYRRSRTEMPARAEEIENTIEEGVELHLLTNPVRFIGNDQGWLTAMECIRMELGEPDSSGRRRPVPIEGSEFLMEVDTAIIAIGQAPNPLIRITTPGLETTKWGGILIDPATGATSVPGVFAGGDAVTGAATVITAMGAGKIAANGIDSYIREKYGMAIEG
ncbi:MAG: NADPH-dependent glutamate synthase [Armatimonadota bacterium]|nr:NADPH-dependent glutamate synthase [Armatimonadota bacterium]